MALTYAVHCSAPPESTLRTFMSWVRPCRSCQVMICEHVVIVAPAFETKVVQTRLRLQTRNDDRAMFRWLAHSLESRR